MHLLILDPWTSPGFRSEDILAFHHHHSVVVEAEGGGMMKITAAGVHTVALAYILMGLPLTCMMVLVWSIGGWKAVATILSTAIIGIALYTLFVLVMLKRPTK
jgi:hypothetical protein